MNLKRHIKEPVQHLITMLSESEALQTMVGAASTAEALGNVFAGYAEDVNGISAAQAAKPVPRAIVSLENYTTRKGATWAVDVQLAVMLQAKDLAENRDLSASDRYLWWLGITGDIIDDIKELAGDMTQLHVNTADVAIPPQMQNPLEDTEETQPIWFTQLTFGCST